MVLEKSSVSAAAPDSATHKASAFEQQPPPQQQLLQQLQQLLLHAGDADGGDGSSGSPAMRTPNRTLGMLRPLVRDGHKPRGEAAQRTLAVVSQRLEKVEESMAEQGEAIERHSQMMEELTTKLDALPALLLEQLSLLREQREERQDHDEVHALLGDRTLHGGLRAVD